MRLCQFSTSINFHPVPEVERMERTCLLECWFLRLKMSKLQTVKKVEKIGFLARQEPKIFTFTFSAQNSRQRLFCQVHFLSMKSFYINHDSQALFLRLCQFSSSVCFIKAYFFGKKPFSRSFCQLQPLPMRSIHVNHNSQAVF